MSPIDVFAIPKGSTVLVTGTNGQVGSHVADQFLQFGYKVRGAVRDTKKNAWLNTVFNEKYGNDKFELVSIPDMAVPEAFDEAIKGVSAISHVATVMIFDPDPNKVIPTVISGAINALKAAYAEPSVKRFIFTSSSTTAAMSPKPNVPGIVITEDTWNEEAVKLAWAEPPYLPERSAITYAASKTQAEQEVWKFHGENKHKRPDLVVNIVLPNANLGKSLDLVNQGHASTSGFIALAWHGRNMEMLHQLLPHCGLLHVAAAIHPDFQDECIFAIAETINWDKILGILRRQNPERKFIDNFQSEQDLCEVKPRARAEQLLRDLGRPGWTLLEDSLLMNTEDLRAAN
ncbi:hypothetical protein BGZ61DRAFT_533343 [Ilyonectria robusta]|uniref:uncharacterized protein n=1 Tax=Ilyonectria robusta TaxID=1079257 RepID=UPI001E8E4720|nr:uncharacterized protein BGZ61DRAFT_533343 [Ilyonectria robusta]KAH8688571.1 hypothetical protein BGZ61DRAFT_533343 [Ilyonectria robusta]